MYWRKEWSGDNRISIWKKFEPINLHKLSVGFFHGLCVPLWSKGNLSLWLQRSHCCSVAKLCLTLFDPMDCSMPGLPVLHHLQSLLKLMSIESVMPSNHLILCHPFSFCPQSFPASESFPMSRPSGGQCIGASASAFVLPMNIQSWFPSGVTGLIALQSKAKIPYARK